MLKDFTKEKFDIIIQAGQSNSEGYGFGEVDDPYCPDDRVWYMNENSTLSVAAEKVTGNEIQSTYALTFAREYLNAKLFASDRKLLILRTAAGGTGFLDHRWGMCDDLYLRMIEMSHTAISLNGENRLVGLLWHQGENECSNNAVYDIHYGNLRGLFESVRNELNLPDLPIVAADFVHDWKNANIHICVPVVDAMRDVCNDIGHCAFVETDGLLSNLQELHRNPLGWEDTIHFSRKSLYELGKRYFTAFEKIIKKTNHTI